MISYNMAIISNVIPILCKHSPTNDTYTRKKFIEAIEYIILKVDNENIKIFNDYLSSLTRHQNLYSSFDIARKIQNAHIKAQLSGNKHH